MEEITDRPGRLRELAALFLRLGITAFGGPAAHLAMMQNEVVERRRWLTSEEFLDLLGATNLIPGPNSTEMAIHIGHRRAGWRGLLLAGICFISPGVVLTVALAWAYVHFGAIPQAQWILYGVKPVIIAVVVQALWSLGRTAVRTRRALVLAALCLLATFLRVNELVVLVAGGASMAAVRALTHRPSPPPTAMLLPLGPGAAAVGGAAVAFSPTKLFLVFLKIGSILFGSGYVLLAFLREDLVERLHWLTEKQLIDSVAAGQVTPGPVFSTATFVGYVIGGAPGAALATVGIFLPSFVFVALSNRLIPRLRRSESMRAALDGVNVASLALMVTVTWDLGRAALVDPATLLLAFSGAVLLLRYKVNSVWLILGGAIAGLVLKRGG